MSTEPREARELAAKLLERGERRLAESCWSSTPVGTLDQQVTLLRLVAESTEPHRIRVNLPWTAPPISPNGSRMHPHAHAGRVRGVLDAARYAIRNAHLEPIGRANVELHWRIPDKRRRDADNLLALLKPCLDALVQEGVLRDDSWRYVPAVTCAIHPANGDPASLWLVVEEVA